MAKKSSQKIRQAKQQKRKANKPKKAQTSRALPTDWTPRETALMFLSLPELEPVRLDQAAVQKHIEALDKELQEALQKPPRDWPGAYDLALSHRQWLEQTVDAALATRALQACMEAAAAYPGERRQFERLSGYAQGHLDGSLPVDENPLWSVLLVVAVQALEPHLLDRARILLEQPRWPIYPLDEAVLAQQAGCTPEDVLEMKAAVDSAEHFADEPEYAALVKLRARLGNLVSGLTPAERQQALASVLLTWARTQKDSPLARRLPSEAARLPEVSLAILGSYLPNGPDDILLDPDSPEWEVILAESCLAEKRYELARSVLESVAASDSFLVHLLLARCCRAEARTDEASRHAADSLELLEVEREVLDDESYADLRAELESLVGRP